MLSNLFHLLFTFLRLIKTKHQNIQLGRIILLLALNISFYLSDVVFDWTRIL